MGRISKSTPNLCWNLSVKQGGCHSDGQTDKAPGRWVCPSPPVKIPDLAGEESIPHFFSCGLCLRHVHQEKKVLWAGRTGDLRGNLPVIMKHFNHITRDFNLLKL